MKIQLNGAIISYEAEEWDDLNNLVCECGHTLQNHNFYTAYNFPKQGTNTVYTSQCNSCTIVRGKFGCDKFRINIG